MKEEKKVDQTLIVKLAIGEIVDIRLQSMMGSTGYGWEIQSIKNGVNLLSVSVIPTSAGIAPVEHVYTFIGREIGSGSVEFVLAAPWKKEEPRDVVVYNFEVEEAVDRKEDDLKLRNFTAPPRADIRGTTMLYAVQAPIPQQAAFADPKVFYGMMPPVSQLNTSPDPRFYYGMMPPVSQLNTSPDPRLYYGMMPPVSQLNTSPDPRLYYGMMPPVSQLNTSPDPRLYYGMMPPVNNCTDCTTSQVYMKYGMPAINANNLPIMPYGFPQPGACC